MGYNTSQRTLAGQVTDLLRQEILSGRLRDSEVLPQVELARRYGVSTIPLREALKTLETEGFVTFHSFQGAFVAPLTVRELSELGRIHTALECEALRQGVRKMSEASIEAAAAVAERIPGETDPLKRYQLAMQYHDTLYAELEMPLLFTMIKQVSTRSQRYLATYMELAKRYGPPPVTRLDVIAACRKRDSEAAAAAFTEFMMRLVGFLVYYAEDWQKPPLLPKKPQKVRK